MYSECKNYLITHFYVLINFSMFINEFTIFGFVSFHVPISLFSECFSGGVTLMFWKLSVWFVSIQWCVSAVFHSYIYSCLFYFVLYLFADVYIVTIIAWYCIFTFFFLNFFILISNICFLKDRVFHWVFNDRYVRSTEITTIFGPRELRYVKSENSTRINILINIYSLLDPTAPPIKVWYWLFFFH